MKVPPRFTVNSKILSYVSQIDAFRIFFSAIDLPKLIKDKIQRVSYLKSSLFSARIEGNPVNLREIDRAEDKNKREIYNILSAINFLENFHIGKLLSVKTILLIHEKVISEKVGFRHDMSAIYNQAGMVVYLPPPPNQVRPLIDKLISYVNRSKDLPLVTALIAHLVFEKIHPFLDGNGRVGRLLINAVLKSKKYNFGLAIPFEEYLDKNKAEYYYFLDIGLKNTEDYLVFMLKAILTQTENIKIQIEEEKQKKINFLLPPRQEEILQIITDHKIVSFDFIRRRFLKVRPRTLHYDLKKLMQKKIVIKIGKTKGVYYRIRQ